MWVADSVSGWFSDVAGFRQRPLIYIWQCHFPPPCNLRVQMAARRDVRARCVVKSAAQLTDGGSEARARSKTKAPQTKADKTETRRAFGGARLTQVRVRAGQQLPELIQTGRFPLRHGRRARCVLVSHASHERDDRRPVGQGALSVQGGVLTC